MSVFLTACMLRSEAGAMPSASLTDRKLLQLGAAGLSDRECERLRLMRRDDARCESVGARLALLSALSGKTGMVYYGDLPPAEVLQARPLATFGKTPEGAPVLARDARSISLAHCDRLAVAAVTEQGRIGVDVEPIDRHLASPREALAQRFFSEGEREQLAAKGNDLKAFLRIWTRKEALGKARGQGLAHLETLDTAMLPPGAFSEWEVEGCLISVCVLE